MNSSELAELYRGYIACLNARNWTELGRFVQKDVTYNGEPVGLPGYQSMLERDFREIPDLHFDIELLVSEPPIIASRLRFDCTPKGTFLGLPVDGRRVRFSENVFYRFREGRIERVWSVIDKSAIEAQLA